MQGCPTTSSRMNTAPTTLALPKTVNAVGIACSVWLGRPVLVNEINGFVSVKINENTCCKYAIACV